VAGRPDRGARFVHGFHLVALGSAGLYVLAAVFALAFLPGTLLPPALARFGGAHPPG
jgi:DHA2 family methylenomycin A resistance protein-like MFS transporter